MNPSWSFLQAPGSRYEGKLRPEVAYELGQHHVFAYVFANADMRPRNAFLWRWASGRASP